MARKRQAGASLAALFVACAVAAPALILSEGWRLSTYADPIGIATACGGVTGPGVVNGKTYTENECLGLTAQAALKIAVAIAPCAPETISTDTRAAFIQLAYNIGPAAFCKSTVSRKALAGDLKGACAGLSAWVYAGGKVLPGLVRRRAEERALCEKGLA